MPFLPHGSAFLVLAKKLAHVACCCEDHAYKAERCYRIHCSDCSLMNSIIENYIAVSFAYKILLPESCHPFHKRIDLAGEILVPGTIELHRDIRHSICRVAFLSPEEATGLHISG